ncbi:MAG: AAA family ATPase [Acidimicrobiia bacterium]
MATCAICGKDGEGRFCAGCGAPLSETCRSCGADLTPDARFCSTCGVPVASTPTLAVGLSNLHLGPDERRRILSDIQGEHRLVTVVFADMTSSVEQTAELAPEDAARLVGRLLETMVDVLVRQGGRIDRFLGDGLLAVFGIPDAHEDDPIRAVRASLEIRDRADELGLGVSIGINTGTVYFGPMGSNLHEELTVMGPVVNLAARLQGKATDGQILVGGATHDQVHAAFDFVETRLDIKGIAGPVAAHSAERILDRPDKVRGIDGLRTALVGRQHELDRLRSVPTDKVAAVIGGAGVGKSRLVSEFHREFVDEGGVWFEGRCLELTRGVAYGPIRDLLDRQAGGLEGFRTSVEDLIASGRLASGWMSDLGPFLTGLLGEDEPTDVEADQRARLTALAVTEYLRAAAGDRDAVIFIDDLHWSDDRTVELLAAWPGSLELVVAARPDPDSPAARLAVLFGSRLESIEVSSLTETESRALLNSLLSIERLPESVSRLILETAEGNPFFVEEIIRSFIQRELIAEQDGTWTATGEIADVAIPPSVQAVVMSRVDRLDRAVRRCAQVASVIGRSFTRELLESVIGSDVGPSLGVLLSMGLIEWERAGDEYVFLHALTRQGVFETLLPSRRAELHERVGLAYEQVAPRAHDQLAYQFGHSRNHAKAVRYLILAATDATDAYLTDTASAYLEQALDRVDGLPEGDRPAALSRVLAIRGELAERSLRHHDARNDLRAALETVEHAPLEAARLHRLIGLTYRQEDRFDDAHAAYDTAEATLEVSPERASTPYRRAWIEIQKERSYALYFGGRGRELPEHNTMVEPVIEEHGTPIQKMDHLLSRTLAAFPAERFALSDTTIELAARALHIADEHGNLAQRAESRFVNGFALLWGDRMEQAERLLSRAVADSDRIGDVMLHNRASAYHAICLRRLARVDEAATAALAARELAGSVDDSYYAGHAEANLAWVAWRTGDFDAARRHGEAAYESWGPLVRGDTEGLNVEFAFLAAWPMLAISLDEEGEARRHLEYLRVPWERTMPPDLDRAIDMALAETGPAMERHAREALTRAAHHCLA